MDELLTPVSTTYLKAKKDEEPLFTEIKPASKVEPRPKNERIESEDEALDILRAQPDYDSLISSLKYLDRASSLRVPTPKSAAIIQALVTEIAPNYWTLLSEGSEDGEIHHLELFVQSLQSVTGINALISHLRALLQESKSTARESRRPDISLHLHIFLEILAAIFRGEDAIRTIWSASTSKLATEALRKVQSHALLSALTNGKLLSVTGEASSTVGKDQLSLTATWVTDGLEVSRWIGRNVVAWVKEQPEEASFQFCSSLIQRSMSLGYPGWTLLPRQYTLG